MMQRRRSSSKREPTIALINVVFLMLVFFMVAGQMAAPVDKDLTLVETRELVQAPPAEALVLHPDGRLTHAGAPVADAGVWWAAHKTEGGTARVIPDRAAPAKALLTVARALRSAGAERVMIVTEKALQ